MKNKIKLSSERVYVKSNLFGLRIANEYSKDDHQDYKASCKLINYIKNNEYEVSFKSWRSTIINNELVFVYEDETNDDVIVSFIKSSNGKKSRIDIIHNAPTEREASILYY